MIERYIATERERERERGKVLTGPYKALRGLRNPLKASCPFPGASLFLSFPGPSLPYCAFPGFLGFLVLLWAHCDPPCVMNHLKGLVRPFKGPYKALQEAS